VIVHLVDAGNALLEERDPLADYEAIRKELTAYGAALAERAEIVALDKIDLIAERDVLRPVEAALRERCRSVHRISSATGEGIPDLLGAVTRCLDEPEEAA
jgi:GTP-binding protein